MDFFLNIYDYLVYLINVSLGLYLKSPYSDENLNCILYPFVTINPLFQVNRMCTKSSIIEITMIHRGSFENA